MYEKSTYKNRRIKHSLYTVLIETEIKAIDSVGDPPLPIPNRAVKPDSADGTALSCGRVGHRHFYRKDILAGCPFFCIYATPTILVIFGNVIFGGDGRKQ